MNQRLLIELSEEGADEALRMFSEDPTEPLILKGVLKLVFQKRTACVFEAIEYHEIPDSRDLVPVDKDFYYAVVDGDCGTPTEILTRMWEVEKNWNPIADDEVYALIRLRFSKASAADMTLSEFIEVCEKSEGFVRSCSFAELIMGKTQHIFKQCKRITSGSSKGTIIQYGGARGGRYDTMNPHDRVGISNYTTNWHMAVVKRAAIR